MKNADNGILFVKDLEELQRDMINQAILPYSFSFL
jgi:hypothetical protein